MGNSVALAEKLRQEILELPHEALPSWSSTSNSCVSKCVQRRSLGNEPGPNGSPQRAPIAQPPSTGTMVHS
jgi:hypothetical protein